MDNQTNLEKARDQVAQARLLLYQAEIALAHIIDGSLLGRGVDSSEVAAQIAKASGISLAASNAIKRWADGAMLARAFGMPPAMHFGEPPQPPGNKPDVVDQLAQAVAQSNQPAAEQPTQPNPQVEALLEKGWKAIEGHEANWAEARRYALQVLDIEPNNQEAIRLRDFADPKVQTTIAPAVGPVPDHQTTLPFTAAPQVVANFIPEEASKDKPKGMPPMPFMD